MQQSDRIGQPNENNNIVIDPVCRMQKPKNEMKETSEFLGKTYYFCSKKDQELFDAHPDHWVSEEERKKARS